MKALDTNILVRFLVQDDEKQVNIVNRSFLKAEHEKESFYVTTLVVLELMWVLKAAYDVERADILAAISELLSMSLLKFQDQTLLRAFALDAASNNLDLSDLLIGQIEHANNCDTTFTFDKKAAKSDLFTMMSFN